MIKPQEIHYGNWLKANLTGQYIQADWLVIKHIADGNIQNAYDPAAEVYSPVLLTEELLLKCGFVKTLSKLKGDIDYYDFRLDHFALYILPKNQTEVEYYPFNDDITMKERTYLVTIKHLHRLQNLYFVLTGVELKIAL